MSIFKDFVLPPLVLTVLCAVVATSLVFTESITTPIIEEQKIAAANAGRAEVMPGVSSFEKIEVAQADLPEGAVDIYKAADKGYVVTGSARGYGGPVVVMVGIGNDGIMTGAKVLEHTETSGLGSRVAEPAFTNQFVGEDAEMKSIELIGGVTVSGRAFMNAVKAAYQLYGQVAGVSVGGGEPARDPLTLEDVQKIFPDAGEFTRLESTLESYRVGESGYIIVTTEPGFADDIVAAVGFDNEGVIVNVIFTKNNETPDYGLELNKQSYLDNYIGKSGDVSDVEGVAGATITSDALRKLVQRTVDAFAEVKDAKAPVSLERLGEMMADMGAYTGVGLEGAKYALKSDTATGLVMQTEGFGGEFTVLVVVNNADGSIAKVAMGPHNETEGYGAAAAEESYTSQYVGKTSTDGIEAIGGATITSDSFKGAVDKALEIVKGE